MEITVKEAATRLGLHPTRIRQLITEGKLPAKRHGKRVLFINESDLELVKANHGYSKTNPNLLATTSFDDLINTIKIQNSKIENLEKELLKLKEKFSLVERNSFSNQEQSLPPMSNSVTSLETKSLPSKSLATLSEPINKPYTNSINAQTQRLQWLKANQEKYAGKYLAFDQEKLLSVATTYKEARETAINLGVLKPFVVHVPDPNIVYHINW